jgi:hypothetical protein
MKVNILIIDNNNNNILAVDSPLMDDFSPKKNHAIHWSTAHSAHSQVLLKVAPISQISPQPLRPRMASVIS